MPGKTKGKCRLRFFPDSMHPPAATLMSATPSIDAYDAQMLDFPSDPDVPMHITGSAEFFAESLMEHDDHLAASAYGEHASVEVDMDEYVGDNAEYEMADETAEYPRSHDGELLDVEVYDASHAPSPLASLRPLQPSVDVPIDSENQVPTSPAFSEHTTQPELRSESEAETHPALLDHPEADPAHVEPSTAPVDGVLSETVSELARSADASDESALVTSESHEQLGEAVQTSGQTFKTPGPADADGVEPHVPPLVGEHPPSLEVAQHENSVPPRAEAAYNTASPAQVDKAVDQTPATEGVTVDPLHISDGVYIDPPPPVLLFVADLPEPTFTLFNRFEVEGDFVDETRDGQKSCSVLLENRPTLYYEPLSSVFEALRQDEGLLSRIPHSFEGELVLDAYDLQLAISEDNVHSREISLHDLNILHDGSDFLGPLRLLLRATVPRFIIRYYSLQEQIQRLNVAAAETGEGEDDEEHHERYNTGEEQPQRREEEAGNQTATRATAVSEGPKASPTTEAQEKPVNAPVVCPEPSAEVSQEPENTTAVQEPAAEYHEVPEEASHDPEDEDDYNGSNAGDEDESVEPKSLDADQIHDTATEDTDAPATATGQESEFGGEPTEYLDYVQPEEYDERYGEVLPEQVGGGSPVQYGEPPHNEEGEQDTSTAVDETQLILAAEDEDEEDKSASTPVPPRAFLEHESNQLVDSNATTELVISKQEKSVLSDEEFTASESESTDEVRAVESSSNRETSTGQAKIFSEVEESDSNFISMLEREADAEFDQTFNAEQSGQEGDIKTLVQLDEAWDEWDDEDAEGEDEEDWIEPDAASNESSVTLSSKASSKRSYDEVDPSEELYVENPQSSPGLKRPRVE